VAKKVAKKVVEKVQLVRVFEVCKALVVTYPNSICQCNNTEVGSKEGQL
jgi:hypothetical protein